MNEVPKRKVVILRKKPKEPVKPLSEVLGKPKARKDSKRQKAMMELGYRFVHFYVKLDQFGEWANFCTSTGIKPNDRLMYILEKDLREFRNDAALKALGIERVHMADK